MELDSFCWSEFTISGYIEIDGLYKRGTYLVNNDVHYVRKKPSPMYAFRILDKLGRKSSWLFNHQLDPTSEVNTRAYFYSLQFR